MATTEIHAIRKTPGAALSYVMSDKLVEYIDGMKIWDDCPHEIVERVGEDGEVRKYVRYPTLSSQYQCNPSDPMATFDWLQNRFQNKRRKGRSDAKGGEPLLWHAHQSFKGREVDPVTANQIGLKLAEEVFKGFAVNVSTHTDGANIHNHFVISAWNYEGRKWNCNRASTQKLREVSDRLCVEYGLSVLEKTRKMKLVKYTDANGNIRYYEPTDRKNEMIRKRNNGEVSQDDVNSFRNTRRFDAIKAKEQRFRDAVRNDIDSLLPHCRDYEELLFRLRDLGYSIRAKRKNGDWLAHISFTPPNEDKAVRENKLGDGVFYLRENLTAFLAEQAKILDLPPEPAQDVRLTIPYFAAYEYGVTDLSQIDDNWRKSHNEFGEEIVVPRSVAEKIVISDAREADREVRGHIDTTALRKVIAEQRQQKQERKPYLTHTQEQWLVARIIESFQCLQYLEKYNIHGRQQVIDLYQAQKRMYDNISQQLPAVRAALQRLQSVLALPGKIAKLQEKIDAKCGDEMYKIDGLQEDQRRLKEYQAIIQKYKIDIPECRSDFAKKMEDNRLKIERLEKAVTNAAYHMSELETCAKVLDRCGNGYAGRSAQAEKTDNNTPHRTHTRHPRDYER